MYERFWLRPLTEKEVLIIIYLADVEHLPGAIAVKEAYLMQKRVKKLNAQKVAYSANCDSSTARRAVKRVNRSGPCALRGMGRPSKLFK